MIMSDVVPLHFSPLSDWENLFYWCFQKESFSTDPFFFFFFAFLLNFRFYLFSYGLNFFFFSKFLKQSLSTFEFFLLNNEGILLPSPASCISRYSVRCLGSYFALSSQVLLPGHKHMTNVRSTNIGYCCVLGLTVKIRACCRAYPSIQTPGAAIMWRLCASFYEQDSQ